jgi:hypothetical protein
MAQVSSHTPLANLGRRPNRLTPKFRTAHNARMKDHYTFHLSQHQTKGLHTALTTVNQFLAVPEGTPVFPHLPIEGVERPLVVSELKLLHKEILRQIKEQDRA